MTEVNYVRQNPYYTADHEWIDFQGSVAYTGVCSFKLTGFREVEEFRCASPSVFFLQNEVIAHIKYRDFLIQAHMPVDGKLILINEKLLTRERNILVSEPENNGWIALIAPALLFNRTGLITQEQYQENKDSNTQNNGTA